MKILKLLDSFLYSKSYIYLGQSIIVQSSQAEKNRTAAAAKYKKEMIKEQQLM